MTDLGPGWKQKPAATPSVSGTTPAGGTMTLGPEPAAPAAPQPYGGPTAAADAAHAPPAPAPPLTWQDHILQYLGQGTGATSGLNMDPETAGAIPQPAANWGSANPLSKTVPSGAGQWWRDIQQPKPADLSRPQTWYDWAGTRTYHPSAGDIAGIAGMGWTDSLAPFGPPVARAAGLPVPNDWSADAARKAYADAWNRAGPVAPMIYGVSTALQPANWFGGNLIAKGVSPAVDAALPYLPKGAEVAAPLLKRGLTGGTTASALTATQEAGLGGSPMDILKGAAWAFPQGAALGAIPTRGAVTPADVTASRQAAVDALKAQFEKMTFPESQTGFAFNAGGETNPNLNQLLQHKAEMQADLAKDPGDQGAQYILDHIDRVTRPGTEAGNLIQQHQQATTQLNNAQQLHDWMETTGMVGGPMEVINAAKARAQGLPAGSDERAPFQAIASVAPPKPLPLIGPRAKYGMISAGTGGGALASHFLGVTDPHVASALTGGGAMTMNTLADAINFLRRPTEHDPLLQQEINRQYQPMTGQALSPGADLGRTLMFLRQGAQGGPR